MIKIQLLSDLHLELMRPAYSWSIPNLESDIVVLAGDIGCGLAACDWILEQSEILGKDIVWVFGNHETYHHDFRLIDDAKNYTKDTRVFLLEKDILEYKGYRLLGATLWTDYLLYGPNCQKVSMQAANDCLNDHRLINLGKFKASDALIKHEDTMQWLRENLTGTKDIVVTHHMPTAYAVNPKYRDHITSTAFASDLDGFILERQPLAWMFGHGHSAVDLMIGKTKCISNPKGYVHEDVDFNSNLVIELDNI